MNFRTLFLLLLLASFRQEFSQNNSFDSTVARGIKQIYTTDFSNAEATFRGVIADYPENPAGRFFLSMIEWWKILVDLDNESNDDNFYQKLEDVIFQCDKILEKDENNINALFFKGGAIGFRGRLRAIRESWLKAVDDGREALPIVQFAAKLDPANKDVQLGFGIYNYYASVIPEQFPLVKPLMIFFPGGDKAKGIEQLNDVAYNGKYSKYEARYFLMTLYSNYENNASKADEYAQLLVNEFPENPVFIRWRGRIAVQRGAAPEYFAIFRKVFEKASNNEYGYSKKTARESAYYIGLYYKNISRADSAFYFFQISDSISQQLDYKSENGFIVNSVLYSGLMLDVLGRREEALGNYNKVLDMKDYANSREAAKRYISMPYKF